MATTAWFFYTALQIFKVVVIWCDNTNILSVSNPHCKCFDHKNYGFWPCPKSGHNVTIVSMTFWKKKFEKKSKKWDQKKNFFRVKKIFFCGSWLFETMVKIYSFTLAFIQESMVFDHNLFFFHNKMFIYFFENL